MEEQLNMMRRGRQFKQLMNKKMDGIIREYDVKRVESRFCVFWLCPVSGIRQQIFIVILI